tara:strand:- start:259 stop:693 length:435 start_codon:yes stop_codon:yes gene_type:complete
MKFDVIRQILEEHLGAINENTYEIQSLFDYLNELEVKYEKLSQRLDSLQLENPQKRQISPLSDTERRVFLLFYTDDNSLTYEEIATQLNLSHSIVQECLSSLVTKGVPLHRCHLNGQILWKLEANFKELQAKENLVNLSLTNFI